MKVYKFGGASVKNADGVRNLRQIIDEEQQLFIIVSAMGKTTNALERVFAAAQKHDPEAAQAEIALIRENHATIIADLWHGPRKLERVEALFADLEAFVAANNYTAEEAEAWYDRIVAYGELISTTIISEYLNYAGLKNCWIDMRSAIRTEQRHKDAEVDIEASSPLLKAALQEAGARSSWGRALSAVLPTARRRPSAVRARTTRLPWWPTSSMPSRCPYGKMWTAC